MKTRIFVTLKNGVLDPQGKAIHHALEGLGFNGVSDVRAGRARRRRRLGAGAALSARTSPPSIQRRIA